MSNIPPESSAMSSEVQHFHFHESAFKYASYVKLADALQSYLRQGQGCRSQISLVDPVSFLTFIKHKNIVESPSKNTSVLKVYDPIWANEDPDADPEKSWENWSPKLFDYCKNELKIYERASSLMGDVIPSLYAYGNMVDVSVLTGQEYLRFTGPFVLIERIEAKANFEASDVGESFVTQKIVPAFKSLHELKIVHNNVKWSNMIVTEDEEVKIIDFSHSFVSSDSDKFKREIINIYNYFGVAKPESLSVNEY